MLFRSAQAEDIAQDVLMRMLTYKQGWFSTASFHTWLRRAIINRAIDVYRKRKPSTTIDDAGEIADSVETQEQSMIESETEAKVSQAVLALPERQRAAITLCFYENMALAQAADVLKIDQRDIGHRVLGIGALGPPAHIGADEPPRTRKSGSQWLEIACIARQPRQAERSEEHTSELQSH